LKRYAGRFGEPTEYIEFKLGLGRKHPCFVAQHSRYDTYSVWYVFEVWPGKKGQVKTLSNHDTKGAAEYEAKRQAYLYLAEQGIIAQLEAT